MRSRSRLHFNQLEAFKAFCRDLGWVEQTVKGEFEVLRMTHPKSKEVLIIHARTRAKEHLTTWGISNTLTNRFIASKRSGGHDDGSNRSDGS